MDEPIPTKEQYQEALAVRVYDDPALERERQIRLRIARLSDPLYQLENWISQVTSRVSRSVFRFLHEIGVGLGLLNEE